MGKKSIGSLIKVFVFLGILLAGGFLIYQSYLRFIFENQILKQIVERLKADSRVAEVLVTEVKPDGQGKPLATTIKFLEYDAQGHPLSPKYFTFRGNIIQFQSLVIRFDDALVQAGSPLMGKSAYLFWKAFVLDGSNTQEFVITSINEIPQGYKVEGENPFEIRLWQKFWEYALESRGSIQGVKNAQIEAPGTRFVPGLLYTLRIEHDGGIRIDAQKLPAILKGESIPK